MFRCKSELSAIRIIISPIPLRSCHALESFAILNSLVNKSITIPMSITKTIDLRGLILNSCIYDIIIVLKLFVVPI